MELTIHIASEKVYVPGMKSGKSLYSIKIEFPYLPRLGDRIILLDKDKAEIHILTGPHDVIGSPGVVEKVAMNAGREIRLAFREGQGRLAAQCDDWRIESFYKKGAGLILVAESLGDCVHMTIARLDDI